MFYEFFRWIAIITAFPLYLLYYKSKTYYEDGVDRKKWKKRGALVISNHFSVLDYPLVMYRALPHKLHVIASEHAFRNKLIRFGMRFFGGIEANRIIGNMSFIGKSADLIKNGKLVLIYPEGRNTPDGNIQPFKKSYILIAHAANAPIIPIVTDGNYGFFKRAHVIVGNQIDISGYITSDKRIPTKEEREKVNEIVYGKMLALREQLEELKKSKKHKKESK